MANPTISNTNQAKLRLMDVEYQKDVVNFGAAESRAPGQLLGRKAVSSTVTADGTGNTGDGTCTALGLAPGGPPKVGDYTLECVEAITNSGRFSLTDPDGRLLTSQIVVPVSSSLAYEGFGLKFTLADGATDFIVGDSFALTVTADGALDSYDRDALDGSEDPIAVYYYDRTEASAADYPDQVIVRGKLSLSIVETASGITLTQAEKDAMLARGLEFVPGAVLDSYDNQ